MVFERENWLQPWHIIVKHAHLLLLLLIRLLLALNMRKPWYSVVAEPRAQSWFSFVHIYESIIAVLTTRTQHIHHFGDGCVILLLRRLVLCAFDWDGCWLCYAFVWQRWWCFDLSWIVLESIHGCWSWLYEWTIFFFFLKIYVPKCYHQLLYFDCFNQNVEKKIYLMFFFFK